MPRRRKNAGLDRAETLRKSERWLVETAQLELSADGAIADVNEMPELDAGMVRDVARLHALESALASGRPWVWARRVVSARRVIATFEEVTRLGPLACGPGRSFSSIGRVRACLAELRGHLTVIVVEDEMMAGHLSRIVRASEHTETRAARERWPLERLAIERRLDRDFERREAESRRVLIEEARAQLARVCALEGAMGPEHAPAVERVERLVTALHARVVAMGRELEPSSARAERLGRLERAMAGWLSERRVRTPSPARARANAPSQRAVAALVSELDALRELLAETVLSSATPPATRARAVELLTSVRHVQIELGGARYLTASRAVAVAQAAMTLVRESVREHAEIERVLGPRTLSALDMLVRALPAWSEALMGELEPRGTHGAPGRKTPPALAELVVAILGEGAEGMRRGRDGGRRRVRVGERSRGAGASAARCGPRDVASSSSRRDRGARTRGTAAGAIIQFFVSGGQRRVTVMDDRPPAPPTDGLLFIEEVALACRVSVSTVRHWVSRGKLRSFRPGRRRLVWRSDLERFLRGAGYDVVERER